MFATAVCVLFLIKLRWPKKKEFLFRFCYVTTLMTQMSMLLYSLVFHKRLLIVLNAAHVFVWRLWRGFLARDSEQSTFTIVAWQLLNNFLAGLILLPADNLNESFGHFKLTTNWISLMDEQLAGIRNRKWWPALTWETLGIWTAILYRDRYWKGNPLV